MIISCPNCNKKFNIDGKLIPEKGRLLQCSVCNHKWHYKIQNKENEYSENFNLQKKDENVSISNEKNIHARSSLIEKNNSKKKIKHTVNINKNLSLHSILTNLIIGFITFCALILILDTFKSNISIYLPILIPLLDSLYQSLFDLSSFIKDLFN